MTSFNAASLTLCPPLHPTPQTHAVPRVSPPDLNGSSSATPSCSAAAAAAVSDWASARPHTPPPSNLPPRLPLARGGGVTAALPEFAAADSPTPDPSPDGDGSFCGNGGGGGGSGGGGFTVVGAHAQPSSLLAPLRVSNGDSEPAALSFGGGPAGQAGGSGGSGVVIISVPTTNYTGTTTGSPTVTTNGNNTVLTFTASGSYTA